MTKHPTNQNFNFRTSPQYLLEKWDLPRDFLEGLYSNCGDKATESDWAFCIGCCALIESTMNMSICEVLEQDEFNLSKVGMNSINGKSIFLQRYNLIDASDFKFIKAFSHIRNRYAHIIKNAQKSIDELIEFNGPENDAYWPTALSAPVKGRDETKDFFETHKYSIRAILSLSVHNVVLDLYNELERFKQERIVRHIEEIEKLSAEEKREAQFDAANLGRLGARPK